MVPFRIRRKHYLFAICIGLVIYLSGIFNHLLEKTYSLDFQYPYDVNTRKLVNQLRQNEKPDIVPMNVYDYSFTTACTEKCKVNSIYPEKIRLVYIVKSALTNFNKRIAIRSSWGFEKRFSDVEIRTVFLLGSTSNSKIQESINKESKIFNDLVQSDFEDSYYNNTIKTMMGFKWAVTYCNISKFYMFVDDDYYISTKNVLRFIRNPTNYPQYLEEPLFSLSKNKLPFNKRKREIMDFELPSNVRLYAGYVLISSPLRHIPSKWYVSLEEYPYDKWPPYVTAGAYILSKESLLEMYFTSFYTKHFRFDDIYLALVAKKAEIEPFHCEEFNFYRKKYNDIQYQYVVASHGFDDPEELLQIWTRQKSLGNA